ncbi:MAG: hypothetical protein ABI536_09160 [Gallionella sp.]
MDTKVARVPLEAPKRSSLPDLSGIFRRVTLNYMLNAVFSGAGAKDDKARMFVQSYIRLIDKTLEEYELSRTNFEVFVTDKTNRSFGSLFRAIGHMENCLYSLARAIRFAGAMADHPEMAKHVSSLSVLQKRVRTRFEKIRNSIEHMDERVRNMKVKVGDLSVLWLGEEHLELESRRINYSELATWLTELHALSEELAMHGSR